MNKPQSQLHLSPLVDDVVDPAIVELRRLALTYALAGHRRPSVNCRWCGQPLTDQPHWQDCEARTAHASATKAALL